MRIAISLTKRLSLGLQRLFLPDCAIEKAASEAWFSPLRFPSYFFSFLFRGCPQQQAISYRPTLFYLHWMKIRMWNCIGMLAKQEKKFSSLSRPTHSVGLDSVFPVDKERCKEQILWLAGWKTESLIFRYWTTSQCRSLILNCTAHFFLEVSRMNVNFSISDQINGHFSSL